MIIGDNIRKAMELKKIESKELAEMLEVSPTYISYLLNDKRKPSMKLLSKLADILEVRVADLMEEDFTPEINIPAEYTDKYKVTSKDKKQYEEEMKKANEAFFLNDELSEDAKKEMLDLMSELFWRAKEKNKRNK